MGRVEGCKLYRWLSKEAKKCKRDREIYLEIGGNLYVYYKQLTIDIWKLTKGYFNILLYFAIFINFRSAWISINIIT